MKMKFKREIRAVFLAVMFITLTCAGGSAETEVITYTLNGFVSVGGGWLSDQPRYMNRGYLKEYVPFPQGFLVDSELKLESKEGLDYYGFRMSHPGLSGDQDYFLEAGKLGVYHAQIEYDQLQHLYCTVNPANSKIGIVLQRLRFSGYYTPTPEIALFAEDDFLRRTGTQPGSNVVGPGNPYNFTTYLRPINYKQNDLRAGVEYSPPNDEHSIFQGRVTYHLSTFENGQADRLVSPAGAPAYVSLPPSNMANYVTAEGALDLKSFYKTRISGSLSYGWLTQNDYTFEATNAAGPPPTAAGRYTGGAGLSATTIAAYIAGVSRPIPELTLKASYRAYDYDNNNVNTNVLNLAFNIPGGNAFLRPMEQYSYIRQTVNLGADYRVNNMLAFEVGYTWQGVDRNYEQGSTSSNSPRVGLRLSPTDWLSLTTNYEFTSRTGSNFLNHEFVFEPTSLLTYKFNSGSLIRNTANVIAEVDLVNNVTTSFNFSVHTDNFTNSTFGNSTFGLQSDKGWSAGVDVSWRPHDRVALSLGYDHQQLHSEELALTYPLLGQTAVVTGDSGPTLTTSDSYDTFFGRADIKLIPNKLSLTTRASYSFSNSNFQNHIMPSLNEYYGDVNTFLTYQFNDHWACKAGYLFEIFGLSKAYQRLYTQGITAAGAPGNFQGYNTLDGFYRNATAHIVQAFLQYRF